MVVMKLNMIDGTSGRMADGVGVVLHRQVDGRWAERSEITTDEHGCWSSSGQARGLYQLDIDIDAYYATSGIVPFYSRITMTVRLGDTDEPQHMSVLITPYSLVTSCSR